MAAATGWKLFQGQKPNPTLMIQNCDLPPPVNVFSGLSDTNRIASNKFNLMMLTMEMDQEEFNCKWDEDYLEEEKLRTKPCLGLLDDGNELLKALRLSQTRAREAEKRSRESVKRNKSLSNAVIHQSMELIAYRNLVKLLELQISHFISKLPNHQEGGLQSSPNPFSCLYRVGSKVSKRQTSSEEPDFMSWVLVLAIPIGIAGLGVTFACRYII